MARIFGILAIVLGVWYAAQHYLEGAKPLVSDEEVEKVTSTPQRAGDKVRDAFAEGNAKRERMLPD